MLLVDKLIKNAALHTNPSIKPVYEALAKDLKQAERFVLQGDAVAAMFDVSQTAPSSLCSGLAWAHAPYPLMWIEWAHRDIAAAETSATTNPLSAGKQHPNRTGLLYRTMGGPDRGVMTLCWDFPGEAASHISSVQTLFDWRDEGNEIEALAAAHGASFPFPTRRASPSRANLPPLSRQARKQLESATELAAVHQISCRTLSVPCHYMWQRTTRRSLHAVTKTQFASMDADWHGEIAFALAVLLLLNVKSYVQVDEPDVSKRMARRKKPKRLTFSEIKLVLPKHQRKRAAEQGASRAEIRRHLVRGHFKIRRTGVFWWSHYARGAESPLQRLGYKVRS